MYFINFKQITSKTRHRTSMKSTTKSIENNIAIYNYKDVTIYLRIMEPIKNQHVIWYQS